MLGAVAFPFPHTHFDVTSSPPVHELTLLPSHSYVCTFGGELAINSILSAYYLQHQPAWGQTKAGQWAAMFGLLNVVTRPAGGIIADIVYRMVGPKHGIASKKCKCSSERTMKDFADLPYSLADLYAFLCAMQGVMAIWVGFLNPSNAVVMVLGIALIAIPMDAANGVCYSLVPHINPQINGVLSGLVGASGNLG